MSLRLINRLQGASAVLCVLLGVLYVIDAVMTLTGSAGFLGMARGPVEGLAVAMLVVTIALALVRQSKSGRRAERP